MPRPKKIKQLPKNIPPEYKQVRYHLQYRSNERGGGQEWHYWESEDYQFTNETEFAGLLDRYRSNHTRYFWRVKKIITITLPSGEHRQLIKYLAPTKQAKA